MTRNNKLILASIIGFIVLTGCCMCVAVPVVMRRYGPQVAERMIKTTPEEVKAAAAEMLHYELPAGFSEQMLMNTLGTRMLTITSDPQGGEAMSITIAQFGVAGMANNRQQPQLPNMDRWLKAFGMDEVSMKPVEDRTYTINGGPVRFTVMETSYQGRMVMRQMSSDMISMGKKTYQFQVTGTSEGWDEDGLEAFFKSIRPVEP